MQFSHKKRNKSWCSSRRCTWAYTLQKKVLRIFNRMRKTQLIQPKLEKNDEAYRWRIKLFILQNVIQYKRYTPFNLILH